MQRSHVSWLSSTSIDPGLAVSATWPVKVVWFQLAWVPLLLLGADILWLVRWNGGLLTLSEFHTSLHMMSHTDGQLDEFFEADGIIICSEMQPLVSLQSLPIDGQERVLIPSTGSCDCAEFQSLVINGTFLLVLNGKVQKKRKQVFQKTSQKCVTKALRIFMASPFCCQTVSAHWSTRPTSRELTNATLACSVLK